jgi:hypothetical protein
MTFDDFTHQVGRALLYGLPTVGLAWFVFQKAAERWVDAHFAKRQKEFEHEQAKELQRIKAKLDTVIQGSLKLQEREFKIIPEAWEKIGDAYGLACWLCAPMQQYTSLAQMSANQLEEFLSKQELLWETQKQEIRDTPVSQRDKLWQQLDIRMRYSRAHNVLASADKFLKANSIFLPDDLRAQFNMQVNNIWEALISFDIGSHPHAKDYKMIREAWDKLKKDGEPLHTAIEKSVRKRLLEQTQLADAQTNAVTTMEAKG